MSASETQDDLSEDRAEQEDGDNTRLVPVVESIRYRKRAQSAERRVEELAGELEDVRSEAKRLADELKGVHKDQELVKRLVAAGARDLETAVLIANTRLASDEKANLDGVVEQLKREKKYMFDEQVTTGASVRTSPAKEQRNAGTGLERAAKRAAGTGNRTDLQEYMKKRRSVI